MAKNRSNKTFAIKIKMNTGGAAAIIAAKVAMTQSAKQTSSSFDWSLALSISD